MSSSFAPSQAELALVTQIFAQGDPQKLGIITGDVAVRIFGGAKLAPATLGEIWGIADEENNGWLSRKGCAIAVRLMGWAQKGEKVSKDLVYKPGPIPTIEGVSAVVSHNTGMSIPRSPPPMPSLPPFTPQDKAKFQNMFVKANPTGGILSGEQARDIFVKSKLPNEKLLQIWNLADTQDRGALDATDFAIGMYFIQGVMSGQITIIPPSLPPGLYQQAGGGVRTNMTGNSGSFSPGATQSSFPQNRNHIQPQYTGQSQMLQPQSTGLAAQQKPAPRPPPSLPARPVANPSRIGSSAFGPQQQSNGFIPQPQAQWDVTAAEKAQSDAYFDTLDTTRAGYIEGEVAVPFMLETKLPGEVLAQIWDLSDLNNDGRLTREGFAVAMHLITKKLGGGELPDTLPQSLIPPSMRSNGAIPVSSPFQPIQQPQEPPKDLFFFDDTPLASATSPPVPSLPSFSAPSTAPSTADPFGTSSPARDLLSDDDEQPLQDQSAEIGNVQNQLNSTNRSLDITKTERQTMEQTLANQAAQLSALQTQLSSAKAGYETETKLLAVLKERFANQSAEIQKTREELIRSESDLSAVRVEKAEIEGNLLRDKEEARDLHRKMVEAGQQAEALKAEVEKVKKDAKQQKGLLAIARKQLSSKETERAKADKELAEAKAETESITQERVEVEAELEKLLNEPPNGDLNTPMPVPERSASADTLTLAASQALPASPDVSASPPPGKSNNPFERLAMSNPSSPRPQSPFLPFANAPVPTPPTANGTVVTEKPASEVPSDDPFGFAQAFETSSAIVPQTTGTGTENLVAPQETGTPKAAPAAISVLDEPTLFSPTDGLASPTATSATDEFKTPPTTTSGFMDGSPARQTTAEMTAAKFPDIDVVTAAVSDQQMPGHFADASHVTEPETDLSSSLKEIEADDSDSDSSDEEDEVPLADLAKQKQKEAADTSAAPTSATPAPTSFDDAFGFTSAAPEAAPSSANAEKDLFGITATNEPATSILAEKPSTSHVLSPTETGVNAFDEAMGKISSPNASTTTPATAPQFSFDTTFDDNFDFASAGGSSFPPAPTTNGNGSAVAAATTNTNHNTSASLSDGFEGLFTQPVQPRTNTLASPAQPRAVSMFVGSSPASSKGPSASGPGGSSFDEIFSPLGASDEPSLALSQASEQPSLATTRKSLTGRSDSPSSPSRATLMSRSMTPPPRAKSPPHSSSPKNRPSTSSSKDIHHEKEKKEAPPTRTSKLSLRLPFGKKKKQEAPPPPLPAAQLLTPPQEEPDRHGSPAVEDDVEAVKQLTDMGFSRSQAVSALEKYSYDVPRALNSLLGQQ